jgi:hypothetical protein
MFNQIMMSQINVKTMPLRQDLLDNLANSETPMTNIQLFENTRTWASPRDISIELVKMKTVGLVLIIGFDESVYPPRGLWVITDAGKKLLEETKKEES